MTIEEAIEKYSHNAEYERTNGNLQGCLAFRQLVEWLKDYKRLIEQEPKIGRWINIKDTSWKGGGYWQCSNCKNGFAYDAYFEADEWEYCPKCGAKMESEN